MLRGGKASEIRNKFYFNEAERLDPRNVQLLTNQATTDFALRHFPEALRKLDRVLDLIPDDADTLAKKAVSHRPRVIFRGPRHSSLR